jgi:hypothetical protein
MCILDTYQPTYTYIHIFHIRIYRHLMHTYAHTQNTPSRAPPSRKIPFQTKNKRPTVTTQTPKTFTGKAQLWLWCYTKRKRARNGACMPHKNGLRTAERIKQERKHRLMTKRRGKSLPGWRGSCEELLRTYAKQTLWQDTRCVFFLFLFCEMM